MRPLSHALLPCAAILAVLTPALSAGCSSSPTSAGTDPADAGAPLPPRICKPAAQAQALPWFTDATADVGLAAQGGSEPLASTVIGADLDGDGWVDLLAQHGVSSRGVPKEGTLAGKQTRFVLMNRPDPANPAHRIYVDTAAESGILATRDGANDHGYGLVNVHRAVGLALALEDLRQGDPDITVLDAYRAYTGMFTGSF
jgi:hypothetical protein